MCERIRWKKTGILCGCTRGRQIGKRKKEKNKNPPSKDGGGEFLEEIIRPVAFLFSLGGGLLSGGLFASGGGFSRGAGLFFYFLQTGGFAGEFL